MPRLAKRNPLEAARHAGQAARTWFDLLCGRVPGPWWWRLSAGNALLGLLVFASLSFWAIRIARTVRYDVPAGRGQASAKPAAKSGAQPADSSAMTRLRSSDLFGPSSSLLGDRVGGGANATLAELSKTLRLQGILGGPDPQAILVDLPTKQVRVLSAGQFIGQVRLREVRPNSVVLEWNKETLEIGL